MEDEPQVKRRRIIIEDEEEEENEVGSNPDELLASENSEEEEGEDLGENWLEDYAPAPELDYYDPEVLDNEEVYETYEQRIRARLAAEEELDALDAKRKEREMEADYNVERFNQYERQQLDQYEEGEEDLMDEGADQGLNLEKFDLPLREWIAEDRTRREIQRRFRKFLNTYHDGIERLAAWMKEHEEEDPLPPLPPDLQSMSKIPIYPKKIMTMCAANKASLEVSFDHLARVQSLVAIWLTDLPREMLQIFDEVLQSVVLAEFPHYSKISNEIHVRIVDLPILDRLRDLRQHDLNHLVRVYGVVTRRTGVFPQLLSVGYDCVACGSLVGPFRVSDGKEVRPAGCPNCQTRGPFRINQQQTQYGNYQKLTLQETPGSVPAGRVPRYKDIILLGDLIDIARPGEEVEITGIYCHNQQFMLSKKSTGFPVFATIIEANSIKKKSGGSTASWTEEEGKKILQLAKDPNILERIIKSIAPSIYGHRHVKTAIALALFGGCHKIGEGNHRIRGDINVLLLGDPGTAKSQILKYSEKTSPRAVYTTGKGASAVGLTAGVHKDPQTKEWTLEGGALVLADQGVCLIDEFDKMNEQDRTSIHEAMEQQTISVSKAGIVTSLQARCSVIAAANPITGRYDPSFTFAENVELTDPILQRFDILCVLQDTVDPITDERLASFVTNSHMKSHPKTHQFLREHGRLPDALLDVNTSAVPMEESEEESKNAHQLHQQAETLYQNTFANEIQPIEQNLLKKYISYARTQIRPILHENNAELSKTVQLYAELRKQSETTSGVPIAVRHLESIVRMAEASARIHLRNEVFSQDFDLAIKVFLESFVQAQKVSVRKALYRTFMKYITHGEDKYSLLMHHLQGLILDVEKYKLLKKDNSNITEISINQLAARAKDLNILDIRPFLRSNYFRQDGFEVDEEHGVIRKRYMK